MTFMLQGHGQDLQLNLTPDHSIVDQDIEQVLSDGSIVKADLSHIYSGNCSGLQIFIILNYPLIYFLEQISDIASNFIVLGLS